MWIYVCDDVTDFEVWGFIKNKNLHILRTKHCFFSNKERYSLCIKGYVAAM